MVLTPQDEIGAEVHKFDQFFRLEEGTSEVDLDDVWTAIRAGFAVLTIARSVMSDTQLTSIGGAMGTRQLFSHCLLYSVAPENFSSLHLSNESGKDTFDWGADKSRISSDSFIHIIPNFLKITAAKWGLIQKETT